MFCHTFQGEEYCTQAPALLSRKACSHEKSALPNWYIKCYLLLVSYSQNLWSDLVLKLQLCKLSVECVVCLFIFKKKKIEVMDEVKEDRGSHLIGALRNCQNELNNFYYYSPYAAHIDWTAMSVTHFFTFPFLPSVANLYLWLRSKWLLSGVLILNLHELTF